MLNRLSAMIRRRLAERPHYARSQDWFMSLYNRLLMRPAGKWFPGKHKLVSVYLKGNHDPFYLRLGSTDWLVMEELYFDNEYDALAQIQLTNVRQVVDLGANIGLSVRLWRQKFPNAAILAVEPDPDNLRVLRKNCPEDGKTPVAQACAAATPRTVQIDRSKGEWAVRMVDGSPNQNRVSVQAIPLADLLANANFTGDIDLLKCDIEGAEAEVFSNCADWLPRVRAMILEIHASYTLDQWKKDIQAAGVRMDVVRTIKSDPNAFVILAAIPSIAQRAEA